MGSLEGAQALCSIYRPFSIQVGPIIELTLWTKELLLGLFAAPRELLVLWQTDHAAENRMQTDVLIIGAGPAGASLAYHLARIGLHVLIMDRERFPRDKTCGGGLTPRAVRALTRLDFPLADLLSHGQPYSGFRLFSPDGHDTVVRYGSLGQADGALGASWGVVIRRAWLDAALLEHCASAGATVIQGMSALRLLRSNARVTGALVEDGRRTEEIRSTVTVVATGAQMALLKAAGLKHPLERPPAVAARLYLEGVEGLGDLLSVVYTRALAPGYLWLFPVSGDTANVGLGLGPGAAAGHGVLRHILDAVRSSHPWVAMALAHARPASEPARWILRSTFPHARTYDSGLLVVGEAAGLVDPLTGEGITFALESAGLAAPVLARALDYGGPDRDHLAAYDRLLHERYAGYFETSQKLCSCVGQPELLDILFRLGSPLARLSGRVTAQDVSSPASPSCILSKRGAPDPSPSPPLGVHARAWLHVPPTVWLLWRMACLRRACS